MADFTCALYLGMQHGRTALRPWSSLTTGKPAVLGESALARDVAGQLAELIDCERAVLMPSTLHAFVDLFGILGGSDVAIYVDAGTYPIARWGIERIAGRGVQVHYFPRHDVDALQRLLLRGARLRSVVVTDGVCPALGTPAPIEQYLAALDTHGGHLVVDDTQGLGIFGRDPSKSLPYGYDGGGTLRLKNVRDERVLVVSSLAKAFGAPAAVVAGSRRWVENFERRGDTRVHCSPPCAAAIQAARHALEINAANGHALRHRLLQLVQRFRIGLANLGLTAQGGLFPVQTLAPPPGFDARQMHTQLLARGIKTVLRRGNYAGDARLSFIITARHRQAEIDDVLDVLTDTGAVASAADMEILS